MADKSIDKETIAISKEITLVKMLSSNDSAVRKKGLTGLKNWIKKTSNLDLSSDHFKRIWKGLFYYFWVSDMPLVQEAAAERISNLISYFENVDSAMKFIGGFFSMLSTEFEYVSHYRTEKFLMFVRRFLRHTLMWLKSRHWEEEMLDKFSTEIYCGQQILPFTLLSHLNDVFNEELAKVTSGKITTDQLIAVFKGYISCVVNLKPNMRAINDIQQHIFSPLCKQLKFYVQQIPAIAEYEEELETENQHINVSIDDENEGHDENDASMDLRPGRVDVVLPFLVFDEKQFISVLDQERNKPSTSHKAKNVIQQIINMLNSVSSLKNKILGNSESEKLQTPLNSSTTMETRSRKKPMRESMNLVSVKKIKTTKSPSDHELKKDLRKKNTVKFASDDAVELHGSDDDNSVLLQNCQKSVDEIKESASNETVVDDITGKTTNIVSEISDNLSERRKTLDSKEDVDNVCSENEHNNCEVRIVVESDELSERFIPLSVFKKMKKVLKKDKKYTVIDFSGKTPFTENKLNNLPENSTAEDDDSLQLPDVQWQNASAETVSMLVSEFTDVELKASADEINSVAIKEKRKVGFKLRNNKRQTFVEYKKGLTLKPEIPYDAAKMPVRSVLKSSFSSPINPFYKFQSPSESVNKKKKLKKKPLKGKVSKRKKKRC